MNHFLNRLSFNSFQAVPARIERNIEKKLATHDQAIAAMLSAIRQLMNPPAPKSRPIGFTADLSKKG